MFEFQQYNLSFRKGYRDSLYEFPYNEDYLKNDYSNFAYMGYYDGYEYGQYCKDTFQTMSISDEQFMAEIDKRHTQALKKHKQYEDDYIRYKTGFLDGKNTIVEKIMKDDDSFNVLPDVNENDLVSTGFYDGYSYFLKSYVENGVTNTDNKISNEEIVRNCFYMRQSSSIKGNSK